MPQRKAETAFGEIEYETVECVSCETEVRSDEALDVIVGEVKSKRSWNHNNYDQYEVYKEGQYRGKLCPYCVDAQHIALDRDDGSTRSMLPITLLKVFMPFAYILIMGFLLLAGGALIVSLL